MFPVLVVLFIFSLVSFDVVSATAPTHLYTYCPNTTFFPSALPAKTLLSNLSAASISSASGFYNTTVGSPKVYGLYMCRGDDDADTCRDCVAAAVTELSQNCPRGQQAVTWYDECMIRYSNASFFSQLGDNFYLLMWNTNNFTGNLTRTSEVLSEALVSVATGAANGASRFATEQERLNDFQTLYALGQCTPDLSPSDCYTCLQQCVNSLPERNSQGGRVLYFSCNLRYEIYQFYDQHTPSSTQAPIYTYCPDSDFFSTEQAVSCNATIAKLLNNLSSTANMSPTPGFYNTTIGVSPTLYGLYLCRGDVLAATCGDCVAAASTYLPKNCTGRKQAVVLYDLCMIRYSTNYFFGLLDNEPLFTHATPRDVSGPGPSNWGSVGASVQKAAENVTSAATEQGASTVKKMAAHQEKVAGSNYIVYMLAQCTPDLSVNDCISCLKKSVDTLETCCLDNQGGAVYYFSCNLRFELFQFYLDPTAQSNSTVVFPTTNSTTGSSQGVPSHNTKSKNKSKPHTLLITGSVITGVVLLLIGLALLYQMYVRIKLKSAYPADLSDIMTVEALQMDFNTIRAATQNFSIDNKLGQGGFGPVYKGKLESGQEIAVKRLSDNSGQGIVEFKTEVIIVAKLQHRNLVKLLGFCVTGIERILVYEFLPNTSLDNFLSDPTKRMLLNWETRFKIICGIAKGLMYLHEDSRLRVIHRDLKTSNILLDEDLNPKISDFGLAKLFGFDQTEAVTDSIAGTHGYMAPEYILLGHYSIKSDVYSFGVIVLEMVSGQRNKYTNRSLLEEMLLFRSWKLWNEGEPLKLVDEVLNGSYGKDDVIKCVHIGLLCIQESVTKRPNMTSVVAALGGQPITLPLPSPPNFFNDNYKSSISNRNNSLIKSTPVVSIAETSDITDLQGR